MRKKANGKNLVNAVKRTKHRREREGRFLKKTVNYAGQKLNVSISPYFLAMAFYFGIKGLFYTFICSFVALVLHEFSHARESRKRGYVLDELKLMPYGASLYGRFEGVKWQDEVRIAAAGPIFNLFLVVVFVAIWWLVPVTYSFTLDFVLANVSIAAFNVLPVYPLDGGRVALACLSSVYGRQRAYKTVRIISYTVIAACLCLFATAAYFSFNLSFIAVGFFLLTSALIPDKRSHYTCAYDLAYRTERVRRGAEICEIAVTDDSELGVLFSLLKFERVTKFIVYDRSFRRRAVLDEFEVKEALAALNTKSTVSEALSFLKNKS